MRNHTLAGKTAIVTGSGGGIGKAIAIELAVHGARLALNGRNDQKLASTENELRNMGFEVMSVCCDVSTEEGAAKLIDETVNAYGSVDIMVNNVGISMRGKFGELKPAVFSAMFESNILTAVCPTLKALPYIRQSKGSIVFISSLAGIRGIPFNSAYCAAKMSLRALAESIRIEEAENQIHVGIVMVGLTENDPGKTTLTADGSPRLIEERLKGHGIDSKKAVAKAVLKNIEKKKYISVLTPIGKVNYFTQQLFPLLAEKIIIRNIFKFEKANR